jgi:anthranilate 1,2-dioxygenase small subunit
MNEMTRAVAAQSDPGIRDRIEELLCAYSHAIDDGDIDRWPSFFAEDCVYHITNREAHEAGLPIGILRCVGRGMMLDRVKAFHTANIFEPHSYNHVLGRPSIALDRAPDVYACRTNFHLIRIMQDGRSDLFATGKYLDTITLAGGVARFQQRTVVLDSRQIDILLVIPI